MQLGLHLNDPDDCGVFCWMVCLAQSVEYIPSAHRYTAHLTSTCWSRREVKEMSEGQRLAPAGAPDVTDTVVVIFLQIIC